MVLVMSDAPYGLYNENAKNLKETLKSEFDDTNDLIDVVITSPPYADLKDYGDHDDQVGQQNYESFLDDLREIFHQAYEVTSDEGTLWIITDTFKRNNRVVRLPFDIADAVENLSGLENCEECSTRLDSLRGSGTKLCPDCEKEYNPIRESWRMEDHVVWDKQRTLPWRKKGQLRNVHEHICFFSKTDDFKYNVDAIRISDTDELGKWWVSYPERYNPRGKVPGNIWEFPIPKQGQWGPKVSFHPSPFPVGLVERIIRLSTDEGDVVLDPFAGVGTTLAVAEGLNRNPIGFELNEEYIEYYENHTRPNAVKEMKTEQQKFIDTKRETQRKIWTLRIHKYAFKLYRQLLDNLGEERPNDGVNTILTVTDRTSIVSADGTNPGGIILFVRDSSLEITEKDIEKASESLKSDVKGSGDYYELDHEYQVKTIADVVRNLREGESALPDNDPLYIYTGGVHNDYQREITPREWLAQVGNRAWRLRRDTGWPPLISNLPISIDDPTESDSSKTEDDGDQASIAQFSEGKAN